MKRHKSLCFAALLPLLLAPLCAAPGEIPEPPHVATIPPFTSWRISVIPSKRTPEPSSPEEARARENTEHYFPPLESVAGYKNDRVIHEISTWKNSGPTESFVVDGVLYRPSSPRYPQDIVALDPANAAVPDLTKNSFPNLAWVNAQSFVKTLTEEGRQLHFYEQQGSRGLPSNQAWIDAKTRLPARWDDGRLLRIFTFSPAKPREIPIPPAVQKLIPPSP